MKRLLGLCVLVLTFPLMASAGGDEKDPSKWVPIKIPGKQKLPEFTDIEEWVNSKALSAADLKGKVVVVHFYACGCSNCIANYPWYKAIWKEFKDKGVVVIGIHTPETEGEKDSKRVKKKAETAELTFPIAIDNKTKMWQLYDNHVWPTIYLFDKEGLARWGWVGELGWKGARGESHMRKKLEELLKE
jgi:peroxiredoxin